MPEIKPAEIKHLTEIESLLREIVDNMRRNSSDQWDSVYPDMPTIENDIRNRALYLTTQDDTITGMIVLNDEQDPGYCSIGWKLPANRIMVIHRLCVHPQFQGRGLASRMMDFAESFAATHNYDAIRLDAYSINPAALRV